MGRQNRGSNSGKGQGRITWAQAFRDIVLKAISTGQLVPLSISTMLIIAVYRMPSEKLPPLVNRILDGLQNNSLTGWGLSVCFLVLWQLHSRKMRRIFSEEAARIGKEKTRHQQARTRKPLGTSDN